MEDLAGVKEDSEQYSVHPQNHYVQALIRISEKGSKKDIEETVETLGRIDNRMKRKYPRSVVRKKR